MASTTYVALRAWVARRAPWLIPVISTSSATGQTTYLTDSVVWTDPSSTGFSAETVNGMHLFQPTDSVAGDRKRIIGGNSGNALDTTNARIYPRVAWTNAPQSGEQYEISSIDPQTMFNLLVDEMNQLFVRTYSPLPFFADADQQLIGEANITISGAGARTKVVTAANVDIGAQATFFSAGTAGESLEWLTMMAVPSRQYEVSVPVQAAVGGPIILALWDKTNNAEIEVANRVSHSYEGYAVLQRRFTTPSTCEEMSVRIYGTGADDRAYIGPIAGPRKDSDRIFNAPATLESGRYLRKLLIATYSDQISSGVYDAKSRTFKEVPPHSYYVSAAPGHANPYQIIVRDGHSLPSGELWIEHLIKASSITTLAWTATGESTPAIPLPIALIGWAWLRRICEHIKSYAPSDTEVNTTLAMINRKDSEYKSLLRDYNSDLEMPQFVTPAQTWSLNQL